MPTLSDRTAAISEALWALKSGHGLELSVPDQVSIAQALASMQADSLTRAAVVAAFQACGLETPSKSYSDALMARIRALAPRPSLVNVLLAYRTFAIRDLSGQFGGRTTGREEELRNNLLTFLPERGYAEARTGRGRTDILMPSPKRIIEVKVWTSMLKYEDGLVELERYILTEKAEAAFMVVFGDRVPLPSIVGDYRTATAEQRTLEGVVVPVIVVPFEVDQPSKAAGNERRRARGR